MATCIVIRKNIHIYIQSIYILSKLNVSLGNSIGLYRDVGLAAVKATPRQIEIIKKQLCSTFKDLGLRITVEANMKIII